jgi:hypothetical protein
MLIREHASDPVFVLRTPASEAQRRVELRIGDENLSGSRSAVLAPREAQKIAVALLMMAEACLEGKTQTH